MKRILILFLFLSVIGQGQVITTFYTKAGCSDAVIATTDMSSITTTGATSGGNISSDGGCSVTARGVCWNTAGSPTTSDSKTENGTGTGSFSSSITSLTYNTTYYVRAYATTSKGTVYGSEKSFTALPGVGESWGGGIVFYTTDGGAHGYIAAEANQSTGAKFGCNGTDIPGADGNSWGAGVQNTIDIATNCADAGIAAKICDGLSLNGYTDWYLPSMTELQGMHSQRNAIGGWGCGSYKAFVSSTEYGASSTYYINFCSSTGNLEWSNKDWSVNVRCIRKY